MIISIYGGSGTGKTSLSLKVVELLGCLIATRVPTDHYIIPRVKERMFDYLQKPLRYDWDLVKKALSHPIGMEVTAPNFDFVTYQRKSLSSNRRFTIRNIMIIDSLIPYPKSDIFVHIFLSEEKRKQRILERDKVWGTHVIDMWDNHQLALKSLASISVIPNIELDGNQNLEKNANLILKLLDH